MNANNLKPLFAAVLLAVAGASANAAVRPHSKTILIESSANVPALALRNPEAMYLYHTNDGQALLYVESQNGHDLTALNVTDPAQMQRVSQTEIPANSAFDFTRALGDDAAIIRYRNGSGVAVLSFKHYNHPVLADAPAFDNARASEALGQTALLVTSNATSVSPLRPTQNYTVVDTTHPAHPGVLATVPMVTQRLANSDTGTLFLLNRTGITAVRRLRVEDEHQMELDQERGN